jgi:hypothetical protein
MRQVVGGAMTTGNGSTITLPKEGAIGAAAWLDESAAFVESDDQFGTGDALRVEGRSSRQGDDRASRGRVLRYRDVPRELDRSVDRHPRVGRVRQRRRHEEAARLPARRAVGVTSAAPTAIAGDEVIDLVYSVRPFYRANGKFVVSDDAVRILRKLKDANGRYLWQDNALNGLTTAAPASLLGYPVYTEVNMPVVAATSKSVAFGDFSKYQIRDVNGVRLARLASGTSPTRARSASSAGTAPTARCSTRRRSSCSPARLSRRHDVSLGRGPREGASSRSPIDRP